MSAPALDGVPVEVQVDHLLGLADDALVTAQRLTEWVASAPALEEDVALANIALDQLGVARALLTRAGEVEGRGRDEDALAYWRAPHEFACVQLVERPDGGDFAVAMVRLLLLSTCQLHRYAGLRTGRDPVLAAVATRAVPEVTYHRDHARAWVLRLGDGTPESHRRAQAALVGEWPYLGELLTASPDAVAAGLEDDPDTWVPAALADLRADLSAACLEVPADPPGSARVAHGRRGEHTPHLEALLGPMQELARAHEGASW
ncbi:MAG: 1,2-phenylacetyl-CoA epoxidase subunit PaaC [Nocardioides sp.]|nr:1,2-phenylacetyl-CoA epoxidase subunit PaaC [Nocardioides sp.]